MTKKELTLTVSFTQLLLADIQKPIAHLAKVYSGLLGEDLSPRQSLHLLNVQVAALLLVLPVSAPLAYYALTFAWFALALHGCRKALRK